MEMNRHSNSNQGNTFCTIIPVLLLNLSAGAGIINVNPGQSIQAAINAAAAGDQIEVSPGTYTEAIDFLGKAIRLYSSGGPEVTKIQRRHTAVSCTALAVKRPTPSWRGSP